MQQIEGLFPEPIRHRFKVGDKVIVQTIWGDEPGIVQGVIGRPWPMVEVLTAKGLISIEVARVREVEGE